MYKCMLLSCFLTITLYSNNTEKIRITVLQKKSHDLNWKEIRKISTKGCDGSAPTRETVIDETFILWIRHHEAFNASSDENLASE